VIRTEMARAMARAMIRGTDAGKGVNLTRPAVASINRRPAYGQAIHEGDDK
jgi:hypothetical protein